MWLRHFHRSFIRLAVLLVWATAPLPAAHLFAAEGGTPTSAVEASPVPDDLTREQIQARIDALEKSTTLEQRERDQAVALYRSALERLAAAENYAGASERFRQAVETAPRQAEQLRERVAQLREADPLPLDIPEDASSTTIKNLLTTLRAEFAASQNRLKELEEQLRAQQNRPVAIRQELTTAKQRYEETSQELAQPLPETEQEQLRNARMAALHAQRLASSNHITMLENELLSYDARMSLLAAQRELVSLQLRRQAERLKRVQELVNLQSRAEAAQAAEAAARARREAGTSHALVLETAQENVQLSKRLSDLVLMIEQASGRKERIERQLEQITTSFESTRHQLEIAGLNEALGAALRRERRQLPNIDEYRHTAEQREAIIADARLTQFQLEQQRRSLTPISQRLRQLMNQEVPADLGDEQRAQVEAELRSLLQDRLSLINELVANYGRYIDLLADLNRDQAQLVERAQEYANLLDQSLFWIASAPPIGLSWIYAFGQSLVWLLTPALWANAAVAVLEGLRETPAIGLMTSLLIVLLVRLRRDIRRRLHSAAMKVGKVQYDSFGLTLQAAVGTPLLALALPLLLYTLGWLMTRQPDFTPMVHAVAKALEQTALVAFALESFRQMCRPEGLAQAHFRWSEESCRILRRNLTWLLILVLPVTFLIFLTEWQPEEKHRETLGRLSFIIGSIGLAVFARRILHPERGAVLALRQEQLHGWPRWLRYIGYPLAIALPLLLAAMAIYGYYYTALQLQSRLFNTGWLLFSAGVVIAMVARWMGVVERRIALAKARARREAAQAQRVAAKEGTTTDVSPELELDDIDLDKIDDQTRGLLNLALAFALATGLWLIWIDLLPALNVLREFVLWHQTTADGERVLTVTAVDAIFAAITLLFTIVAARNLPGVLELSILPRLALDAGTRYAITTISRYAIVTVGLISVISMLGISWSKAQWLVAALGLGLGFGLQEIFANFVSGLIILFERPIRVGDTVTVGDLSGTVTRIRIRATTVTDWEQREIIIPNKTFITDRLINWTLTDPVTRVLIRIGVAHKTDPELATRIITEVVEANPRVIDEPEFSVYLLSIGESTLNFELRAFVRDMTDRLPLIHELHLGIISALRQHGIQIPFPQRDLHVRSMDPEIRVSRQDDGAGSPASG